MTAITETLIIPDDVRLVPVTDLHESVSSQFDWAEGDIAVTRLRSRTPSRVIDQDFAQLLNEFQDEKSVVEAVLHYSLVQAADPHETLTNALPILQKFMSQGLLVSPNQLNDSRDMPLLRDTHLDRYKIVRCIRTLEDSEIYQAKMADNTTVAIKIRRPKAAQYIDQMLQHEADILRQLNCDFIPGLIEQGLWEERSYLTIEWCPGVDLMRAANERRENRGELLDLCIAVLEAYSKLHESGVMHGDIHPGNILIDDEGQAQLVDFGLASSFENPLSHRGGVPFYYEPEYAAAFLNNVQPPAANPLGEQYALAALAYQFLAGVHYLNFSLEEDLLFKQILEEPTQPFRSLDVAPWPEVELLLQKALSKVPEDRFESVADFCDALKIVRANCSQRPNLKEQTNPQSQRLVDDILAQAGLKGLLLQNGLPRAPYASVNFGAAGVAYALYRMACIRQEPDLLALADIWLAKAEQLIDDEAGFYNDELDISVANIGHVSPYHTPVGVSAVRFLIAKAMGDSTSQMSSLWDFVALANQPCENIDVTLGKAGIVLIGAELYDQVSEKAWASQSGLKELCDSIVTELWTQIDGYMPIGPNCELTNLGIAHGWGGLLLATLRWHQVTDMPLPENLPLRLAELASYAEENGRGCQWLWEFNKGEMNMSGWCNGSAGYVYLWSIAYQLLGDDSFKELAVRSGWHAWEDAAVAGSLCCGLTGRSFSLLELFKLTDDPKWLERGRLLAHKAAHHIRHSQSQEYVGFEMSLYKGELATALLQVELESPATARFPFFA